MKFRLKLKTYVCALALLALVPFAAASAQTDASPQEARAIAKEAYIYGYPMVDAYRVMYTYFSDTENPEFKAPWNQLKNIPRVYTHEDRAIVAPNSDTPYSMVGLDLRAEPMVLTVPAIDPERYYSIQLIDAYTHNFDYIGSRATGNEAGNILVAGPNWTSATPEGIKTVFRSETNLVFAAYRTQLFNPDDLDNVKAVQSGYKVQPLSAFLGQPASAARTTADFMRPLTPDDQITSLEFFNVLNFVLEFCPTHPSEKELMARFAKIGVGSGNRINVATLAPEMKQALADGMADAWAEFADLEKTDLAGGKVTAGDLFGTREYLDNNYLYRFAAAVLGLYGNSKQEAMYPFYRTDAAGERLDASKHRYVLRFAPGQLPPVNAFWSVTMYELPANLLTANPINRYLINSPMLPDLKRDADGGLTLYIQAESPGAENDSNWLPAPNGPFWIAMRLYWPAEAALDGTWQQPPLESAGPEVLNDGNGAKVMRFENQHRTRYIELFFAVRDPKTGALVAPCYNTMYTSKEIPASKDTAPQALVENLDLKKMAQEYGVAKVILNGPKLWMPDWVELPVGKERNFSGMTAGWVAQLNMPETGDVEAPAYEVMEIARASTFAWTKGTKVAVLDDADGNTWILKGFQLGLNPQQTYEEYLAKGAANYKNFPAGWTFRVKTLEKDLIEIPDDGMATIMQDELFHVWDKTGEGMTNYKP
jgi:hypothetical protein